MSWIPRAVIGLLVMSVLPDIIGLPLAHSQSLDVNNQTASAVGQTVVFSVNVQNAPTALQAFGFDLTFDANVLEFVPPISSGTLFTTLNLNEDFVLVSNPNTSGVRIGVLIITADNALTSIPQGQSGELLRFTFTVRSLQPTTVSIVNPVDNLAQPGWTLGDGQLFIISGLTFVPVTPCRLFDTREPAAGGTRLPAVTPASANRISRIFAVAGTPGAPGNLAAQGGAAAGCNIPDPQGGSVAAVVVNLAATDATGGGNIGMAPHDPTGAEPPFVSFLNFGQVSGVDALTNMVVIPICTPDTAPPSGCAQGEDIDVVARINSVHLIGDVVGYFGSSQTTAQGAAVLEATALECLASFTYQIVANHTDFSFLSPACTIGETLTAAFYEFLDTTGAPLLHTTDVKMQWPMPDPEGSRAMLCQGTNQSNLTVQVGCGANCCRTTGN